MRCLLRSALVASAAVLVTGLTGCSTVALEHADLDLPAKNQSEWRLPLDQYLPPLIDVEYDAQQVFVHKCMAEAGHDWVVRLDPAGTTTGESWNSAGRKLFSVHLAETYGYGNSGQISRSPEAEQAWLDGERSRRALAEHAPEAAEGCFDQSTAVLDDEPSWQVYDLAMEIAGGASGDAQESPEVKEAASRWRECMADAGLPDLPAVPEEMPPASVDDGGGPAIDAPYSVGDEFDVSAEERRVAVADATCQDSSGYASALYDAEWEAQAEAMESHADDLVRYGEQLEEQRARAESYLAENAPEVR
jgi:hypothetical protein